jgi:hypothetical protein
VVWRRPRYSTVHQIIANPAYGGAYAYGRTGATVRHDGSGAAVRARRKPREEWLALRPGAHEGYLAWDRAEAIREMVSDNAPGAGGHGAPKHGAALLAGLLRCRRCGRKLTVQYTGAKHDIPRYVCHRGRLDYGEPSCIAFGGLRVDDAVEEALLAVVRPAAIEAALAAEARAATRRDQARDALLRDLEAARYAADRAFRQYDAADPENRLVAGELEARWNRALARVAEADGRIADHDAAAPRRPALEPISFGALADDLEAVWTAPTTDARLKKRIVRTVIREAVAATTRPPGSSSSSAGRAAPTPSTGCRDVGAGSATARRPTSSRRCACSLSPSRMRPSPAFSIATGSRPGTGTAGPGSG